MESIEGTKLLNKIHRDLQNKGLDVESLITDIKALREIMIEAKNPFLVKFLRLTYQHIEQFGTFNIPMPSDEEDEDEENEAKSISPVTSDEDRIESLDYLVELLLESHNKINKKEIIEYQDMIEQYAQQNA